MNEIEKFSFEGSAEVRVVTIDSEPWFVAADVCRVLRFKDGPGAVRKHVLAGQRGVAKLASPSSKSGYAEVTTINEPGLYRLIMRSKVTGAERFQDWVTAEVLPAIRKTGGYLSPTVDFTDPDNIQRILDNWKADRAKLEAAEQYIEDKSHAVLVAEEFFDEDGELTGLREAARLFSIPQNTFCAMLRKWGWIDKYGTGARTYATERGYMENKKGIANGHEWVAGKLTRKGIERIAQRLREKQ